MHGGFEDSDPAAGLLHDREHVEAPACQCGGLDEVGGDDGVGLGAQEGRPRAAGGGALGAGSTRAICMIDFPASRTIGTAPARNSGSNRRRISAMNLYVQTLASTLGWEPYRSYLAVFLQ